MKLVKGVKGEACMCRKCGMVPATQTHRCPGAYRVSAGGCVIGAAKMIRWCVKAKDGWHFSVPNKPHAEMADSVKAACGSFVILPGGCERRTTTCVECLDAIQKR